MLTSITTDKATTGTPHNAAGGRSQPQRYLSCGPTRSRRHGVCHACTTHSQTTRIPSVLCLARSSRDTSKDEHPYTLDRPHAYERRWDIEHTHWDEHTCDHDCHHACELGDSCVCCSITDDILHAYVHAQAKLAKLQNKFTETSLRLHQERQKNAASREAENPRLRQDMCDMALEITELKNKIEELKKEHAEDIADLKIAHAKEVARLKSNGGTPDKSDKDPADRLLKSPATPSSKNSIQYDSRKQYWEKKKALCTEMSGKNFVPNPTDPSKCIVCGSDHTGVPSRIGAPFGHKGHQVRFKPNRTIKCAAKHCKKCGSKKLARMRPINKMVLDYNGATRMLIWVHHQIERKLCRKCDMITTAPRKDIPGTSLGRKLLSHVGALTGLHLTPSGMAEYVKCINEHDISDNAINNTIGALADILKPSLNTIMAELKRAKYIQIDESHYIVNGKRGYVWLVRTDRATFLVVSGSRSQENIPTFFGELVGKYATADGYPGYPRFFKVQRCLAHELLQTEDAARKAGPGSHHDKIHDMFRAVYYDACALSIQSADTGGGGPPTPSATP